MSENTSREVRLASRPKGAPLPSNFAIYKTQLKPLALGEVLVRNLFMSVDPYMRGRMNEGQSYIPAFELDRPLCGGAVGEVVDARAESVQAGDIVTSNLGWREGFVAPAAEVRVVDRNVHPLSAHLGVLGMTGMTAWVGLKLATLRAGEVVFISGAAGAVGTVAGQLAKLRGCRVIGSTGSIAKATLLLDECGFDAAILYNIGPLADQLNLECPEGIDVYFDNVGGPALQAALSVLRVHGRIIACGGISGYNDPEPRPGPSNLFNMVTKRLTMRGFLVRDWLNQQGAFEAEMGECVRSGKLKNKETVVNGLDHAPAAFIGLFHGRNFGKMVVKLP